MRAAIDLVRWQDFEDGEDLFDRLARGRGAAGAEAAATQGYFSADVDVKVDRTTKPATVR
ncbi:MAG: hypothetical protein U1F10_04190 [Burkholderiales bacterium]